MAMQAFKELFLQQGTQEWLEVRKHHITATEVAHIFTKQTSIYQTVMEKRGLSKVKDLSVVPAVREGSEKERLIRQKIEELYPQLLDTDECCLPQPCCESLDDPFFMASLDGFSKKHNLIIEIKNIYSKSDKNWRDLLNLGMKAPIPASYGYEYQVQWQMLVTKAKGAMLVFHHSTDPVEIDEAGIRIFTFKPDPEKQAELIKIANKVKDIMVNNKEVQPEPGDTVFIQTTKDVDQLINMYRQTEERYNALSDEYEQWKSLRNNIKDKLESLLLNETRTRVSTDQFTLSRTFREGGIDYARLIKDNVISEEVLNRYRKHPTSTTRLTLK